MIEDPDLEILQETHLEGKLYNDTAKCKKIDPEVFWSVVFLGNWEEFTHVPIINRFPLSRHLQSRKGEHESYIPIFLVRYRPLMPIRLLIIPLHS
jgi:hypothetical protein